MTNTKDNGGPAFPHEPGRHSDYEGMTLRDYFAARAMQAMRLAGYAGTPKDIAGGSYEVADAMLEARK